MEYLAGKEQACGREGTQRSGNDGLVGIKCANTTGTYDGKEKSEGVHASPFGHGPGKTLQTGPKFPRFMAVRSEISKNGRINRKHVLVALQPSVTPW